MPDLGSIAQCEPCAQERVLNCVGGLVVAEPAHAESTDVFRIALVQRGCDGAGRRLTGPLVAAPLSFPPP